MQRVIDSVDNYLFELYAPREFNIKSENNVLVDLDDSFEQMLSALEDAGVLNPKKLSVYEINKRIIYFEKKNPQKNH